MAEKMKQDTPVYAFSGTATPCLETEPAFCPVATRVSRQLPPWLPLALHFLDIRREYFPVSRYLFTPSEASEASGYTRRIVLPLLTTTTAYLRIAQI